MTLDLSVLATFTLFWLAIVPTPGPNILMVTHVAMTRTPRHVALAIAGNMAGIILLASLALLGWAALLQAFPWLRLAVNILGGAYLLYVGMKLIGRARQPAPPILPNETPADDWKTVALGFVTAVSNAQAILFITSIYAVTGVLQANLATGFTTVAIMVAMNASYLFLIGWLFRREAVRRAYQRFRRTFEGTVGALFLFFGGRLIWRAVMR
jgi:threonine/homoserine/homoserine lactone efflux protein